MDARGSCDEVARPTNSQPNDEKMLGRKFAMRIVVSIAVLGLLTLPAQAQTLPEWAYPAPPPLTPLDDTVQKHLPDSTKAYTQAQIDDGFNAADWYPQDHPPMPDVVAHGRKAANARACAMCHLTSGAGQPESAFLAGLPVGYFMRQMAEFKSGTRKGAGAVAMIPIAQGLNEAPARGHPSRRAQESARSSG
jgi:cytochrome c553